jgi:hypothetical protein
MKPEILPKREIEKYMRTLFNRRGDIHWATVIVKAILEADSPRISDVARAMGGGTEAGMRAIHRFLRWGEDPREAMKLLYLG